MKFLTVVLLIGTAALPALADDPQFDFTYSDSLFTLSGVLDTQVVAPGEYLVTGVDGTITDADGTFALNLIPVGVVPEDPYGDEPNGQDDDTFTIPNSNALTIDPNFYYDNGGLQFDFADGGPLSGEYNQLGGSDINLSAANSSGAPGSYVSDCSGECGFAAPAHAYFLNTTGGTFTLSAVPDGGTTLAFLGLVIAGMATLRRKLSA